MSSLALYRELVPAHNVVSDEVVETWLELAAQRHTASAWGAVYAAAMVMWAAAHVDPQLVEGAVGQQGRVCAPTPPSSKPDAMVARSPYWAWYAEYRDSRAARAPRRVGP